METITLLFSTQKYLFKKLLRGMGIVAGTLAGLLGIGGGVVIVPMLM
jgi:uncharacterized membrane protein YfcA